LFEKETGTEGMFTMKVKEKVYIDNEIVFKPNVGFY